MEVSSEIPFLSLLSGLSQLFLSGSLCLLCRKNRPQTEPDKHCKILVSCSNEERNFIQAHAQGLPRSDFLEAVSDVRIRRYFTQLYAVGLSVQVVCKYCLMVTAAFYCFPEVATLSSLCFFNNC